MSFLTRSQRVGDGTSGAQPLLEACAKKPQTKTVMNIKAIIASLVLGSSSVAMAAPSVTVSATAQGSYGTTIVRDHRDDDGYTSVVTRPAIGEAVSRGMGTSPVGS